MDKTNIKYFGLLGVVIASFFFFTGGVNSKSLYTKGPTINKVKADPAPTQIYSKVVIDAEVTNNSYEDDDCKKEEYYQSAESLTGKVTIKKDGQTIVTDDYVYKRDDTNPGSRHGHFTYNYTFNSIGVYTLISEFTSDYNNSIAKSKDTTTVAVTDGSITPLLPGTYNLVTFKYYPVNILTPLEKYGKDVLGNSYLTINSDNTASLHANVTFDADTRAKYPDLAQNYKYDATGKMSIEQDPVSKSYVFKVEYNKSVYAIFNYSYDGSVINLSYKDQKNNQYFLTFEK